MAIYESTLHAASEWTRKSESVRTLWEARRRNLDTAFLCHSHKDTRLAVGLQNLLSKHGWNVYIDWQDSSMPETPNKETAQKIKTKISETKWFIFLATKNSTSSRWCPWEIGYADTARGSPQILIAQVQMNDGQWYGNEYLQLYKRIDQATTQWGESSYAVFAPGEKSGPLVRNL